MISARIVKANEITGDKIIDDSIRGFHFNGDDVICIIDENGCLEIEQPGMVKKILGIEEDTEIDIEELKEKFVAFKSGISQ